MSRRTQKIDGMPQFTGPFRELIPNYIQFKRAQGYLISDPIIYRLREMDLFFQEKDVREISITREIYDEWTKHKPPEKETTTQKRKGAICGFAKYLVSLGYTDIYTGYDDTRIFKRDFIPYVFSKDEINRMIQILNSLCKSSSCYNNDTFRIAILMYYCCGFRKSEVQNLRLQNLDFETGLITILHGKNDVSRVVPVSSSLLSELLAYREAYLAEALPEDYFLFPHRIRSAYERIIYERFHWLLTEAGIAPRTDGGSQRLHDLRHTFCVRALEQMQEKGFDLYASLPLLSIYLGHKHITETEYYLRMMAEHFDTILDKVSSNNPEIFPRYGGDEHDKE